MIDITKLIADTRKAANDWQAGNWRSGIKDSLAVLTEIEDDIDAVFPAPPAIDPNTPPPLAAHAAFQAPLSMAALGARMHDVCNQHEAQAAKLGAGQEAAAGRHPLIQGFIKNLLPLLIQALKFLPAA